MPPTVKNPLKNAHPEILAQARALLQADIAHWGGFDEKNGFFFLDFPKGDGSLYRAAWMPDMGFSTCSCPRAEKPCFHLVTLYLAVENNLISTKITPKADQPSLPSPHTNVESPTTQPVVEGKNSDFAPENTAKNGIAEAFQSLESGMAELENYLSDLVRRGVATTVAETADWNENFAAKMADASLSGLSRKIRLLKDLQESQLEKIPVALGSFWLVRGAVLNSNGLEKSELADISAFLGLRDQKKTDIQATTPPVRDAWLVMGHRVSQVENNLRARSTWFWGHKCQKFAEFREYSFGAEPFNANFRTGVVVESALWYYPSAYPLRAFLDEEFMAVRPALIEKPEPCPSFAALRQTFAAAIAKNPWMEQWPVFVENIRILRTASGVFFAADAFNTCLPVLPQNQDICWAYFAQGGGHPFSFFAIWTGYYLVLPDL